MTSIVELSFVRESRAYLVLDPGYRYEGLDYVLDPGYEGIRYGIRFGVRRVLDPGYEGY